MMNNPKTMWFLAACVIHGTDAQFCKSNVCLTWKLSEQVLYLKCRVNKLLFRVEFINHLNKSIGECYPPQVETIRCNPHQENVIITQNIKTNETTCFISGTIDSSLNGKWKCLHGTYFSDVEVTVLRDKDQKCGARFWSIVIFFGLISFWIAFSYIYQHKITILEDSQKKIRKCCKFEKARKISACKGVSFVVLTVLIVVMVWGISKSTNISCNEKYITLCILAPVLGILTAVFCLNEGGQENGPGDQGGQDNRPGDQGRQDNRPGDQGRQDNRPGDQGGQDNRPGDQGIYLFVEGQEEGHVDHGGQKGESDVSSGLLEDSQTSESVV